MMREMEKVSDWIMPDSRDYIIDTTYTDTIFILQLDSLGEGTVVASAQIRWDTATRKVLKLPVNADSSVFGFRYCSLYELKFDRPAVIDSLYYIVGTTWNLVRVDMGSYEYYTSIPRHYTAMYPVCPPEGTYYTNCNPSRTLGGEMHGDKFSFYSLDEAAEDEDSWGPFLLMVDSATIEVETANMAMGTAGPTRSMSKWVTQRITATPEYGYRFSHWNDGNTENPRDIYLTQDTHFIAYFEPNTRHSVQTRCEPEGMGIASGDGQYWRGDTATLTATATAPYIFLHWNDGNTENPRRVAIEQDTAFTAYFSKVFHPDTTAGINPVEEAGSLFTLTPNPTTGTVRVEIHTPSPLRGTPPILGGELIVHDAAGHEVMRMKVETGQKDVELDLAALPKGTYLVTLTTPQGTGTQRLVLR